MTRLVPRLAAVTLFAVCAVCSGNVAAGPPDDIEKAVIAGAEKLGGAAEIDPALDEIARVLVKFDRADDNDLIGLSKLPSVGGIEIFDGSKCTTKGLAALKDLPDLQKLVLGKCPLGDTAATAISGIKPLRVVYLGESKITDAGVAALAKLKDLRNLDVYDTRATDHGLAALADHEMLEELNVSGTRVTDAGIMKLKAVKTLKVLRAVRTHVTRNGADALEKEIKGLTVRF
ncbi:MAG: hypothetical protein ACRC7O_06925 [Fimbriiglobus sp.]